MPTENRLIVSEDSSERMVVTLRPMHDWPIPLFTQIFHKTKIVLDRVLQKVIRNERWLFWHRVKEIPFLDIQSVDASRSKTTRISPTASIGPVPPATWNVCDLILTVGDQKLRMAIAPLDSNTKAVAERIAEVTRKPLVWLEEEKEENQAEPTTQDETPTD